MDLYFICYSESFRPVVDILKMRLWQESVQDMGCMRMTNLQLEELHPCFNAQSHQFIQMEKGLILYAAGLSPVPHQPRPLSWPDTLMYGTDASGPETSLKPAETLMLKKAKKGML